MKQALRSKLLRPTSPARPISSGWKALVADNPKITLLVNNAGTASLGAATAASAGAQDTMIALNIYGSNATYARSVLPKFLERNAGAIVNVSSVLSLHTLP